MLAFRANVCRCIYAWNVYNSYSTFSIVFEFLFSLILAIIGLLVNLKFKKKLEDERKARPLGRKGNVIEPIMRWYQIVVMTFWTYVLLFFWLWGHEILPSEWFQNCWLLNITMNILRVGRSIIAYNSFFTALIRYFYIVHHERANLWEFDNVGRIFQAMSIVVPICMEVVRFFTEEDIPTNSLKSTDRFKNCLAFHENWNDTTMTSLTAPIPVSLDVSLKLFPRWLVDALYYIWFAITALIYSNTLEGYLYVKIFQTIKR